MSKKVINVIADVHRSIEEMTIEQRQLFIESLPGLSGDDAFYFIEMYDRLSRRAMRMTQPVMPELLLRHIILCADRIIGGTVDNKASIVSVTPVIQRGATFARTDHIKAGATYKIKFDTRMECLVGAGEKTRAVYVAAPGEEIQVVGLDIQLRRARNTNTALGYLTPIELLHTGLKTLVPPAVGIISLDEQHLRAVFAILTSYEYLMNSVMLSCYLYAQIRGLLPLKVIAPVRSVDHSVRPTHRIFPVLERLLHMQFDASADINVLADIERTGMGYIYRAALLYGADSSQVTTALAVKNSENIIKSLAAMSIERGYIEANNVNALMQTIEKLYGAKRLIVVKKELTAKPSLNTSAGIVTLFGPAERKSIVAELGKTAAHTAAIINNNCPHVGLYAKFMAARGDREQSQLLGELKRMFADRGGSSRHSTRQHLTFIKCNLCHYDLICPHTVELVSMADRSYNEIKATMSHFLSRNSEFCKICGATIIAPDLIQSTHNTLDVQDPELAEFIWVEVLPLTKYLRIESGGKLMINLPKLVSSIRNAIYPAVFDIEKQIYKSKTNTNEELKAKKRLYVAIYALAYMIHLSTNNKFIQWQGLDLVRSKNPLVDTIKHVLDVLLMARNIAIRDIPGMGHDVVRNLLISAYKTFDVASAVIAYSTAPEDTLGRILLDPPYHYFYGAYVLWLLQEGKRRVRGDAIVSLLDTVMGADVATLSKQKNLYSGVKVPKFKKVGHVVPLYVKALEYWAPWVQQEIYLDPVYVDKSAKGDLSNVEFTPRYARRQEQFADLAAEDAAARRVLALVSAHTYTRLGGTQSMQWSNPRVGLGRLYDTAGHAHKWSIYVVSEATEGAAQDMATQRQSPNYAEYTLAEINKRLEGGIITPRPIDRKCSICGVLFSATGRETDDKIKKSIRKLTTISNFYKFYEFRCPEGQLHDIGAGTIECTKCGLNFTKQHSNTEYFEKYQAIYYKEKKELQDSNDTTHSDITRSDTTHSDTKQHPPPDFSKWSVNYSVVLTLASKLKINHRTIEAMGAIGGKDYAQVLSGVYIPPPVDEKYSTRAFIIDTHIKNFITEYNQLRYFHKLQKPPAAIAAVIEAAGVQKSAMAAMSEKLPMIDNYGTKFTAFMREKKPREIVAFAIQSLCEMCLHIWDMTDQSTAKLRHGFVEYAIKRIIRGEELTSKPGHFNWTLLYGNSESNKEYDSNLAADVAEDDDDTTTAEPLINNFDVEEDASDEDLVPIEDGGMD